MRIFKQTVQCILVVIVLVVVGELSLQVIYYVYRQFKPLPEGVLSGKYEYDKKTNYKLKANYTYKKTYFFQHHHWGHGIHPSLLNREIPLPL